MAKTLRSADADSVSRPIGNVAEDWDSAEITFLSNIIVRASVILGRTTITIRDLLELQPGSVIELNKPVGEGVDFVMNGAPFGKVDVTVIEDTYGLRISEIVNPFDV